MFRHILIAADGSKLSAIALRDGVELARVCGARVTFVICSPPYSGSSKEARDTHDVRAQVAALPLLEPGVELAEAAGVVYDREHRLADPAWKGILAAAEEHRCDLVVVASRGHHPIANLVFGSQTLGVLGAATRPVLVCALREGPFAVRHVLAATDGSEASGEAILGAIDLAAATHARVTVATCTVPVPEKVTAGHRAEDDAASAGQRLGFGEGYARDREVPMTTEHLHSDHPYRAIVECAKRCGCDLIVMASRERKGALAMTFGSETLKVLAAANLPVLVWR